MNIQAVGFIAIMGVAACTPPPSVEQETKVVALVWGGMLGAAGEAPPVQWVTTGGACLDVVHDGCADGVFDGHAVTVRWPGSIPASALTHELIHAWLLRSTGNGDAQHRGPDWYMEQR